jgi:general secretion pathway protein L
LKDKAPLLTGLGLTVLVSFFFSAWAELRALGQENEMLAESLASLSKRALGEEIADPDEALQALDRLAGAEQDPMPSIDAFDVMVELSKAVPMTIVHDVDELDMQRDHVKIRGIVGTTAEAQQVGENLKKNPCLGGAKIGKVTQVVNSTRQKYVLEIDIKCPSDVSKKKSKADKAEED